MPATFDSFGIKFLYPDNWEVVERAEDESASGVTMDLPGGGFFSIELEDEGLDEEEIVSRIESALREEYGEVEMDEATQVSENLRTVELRFYYLDLLVVSRVMLVERDGETFVIQIQAESREFDKNEQVFAAILQQIT